MNAKKWIVGSLLVGMLVVGVGAMSAQGPGGRGGQGGPGGQGGSGGRFGAMAERGLGAGFGEVMLVIEEQTGLDTREIRLALQDGSTLAEVIMENGGDVDAVIAEAVSVATERINTAVENERITQERADEMLAELESVFTEAVNSSTPIRAGLGQWGEQNPGFPGLNFGGRGMGGMMFNGGFLDIAADQTGLSVEELTAQIQDGATLAEILTENNVDLTAFVDAVMAEAETRMSENQANHLSRLRERLNEQLGITTSGDGA